MWNKIFAGTLALCFIIMLAFSYISYSWLQSVTNPSEVKANFDLYSTYYWDFLLASTFVLLAAGDVALWITRRAWPLWSLLAYFSIFVLLRTWWLSDLFFDYKRRSGLAQPEFSLSALTGAVLIVAAAIIVFFDQFIILRMSSRMAGADAAELTPGSDEKIELGE
jgi:hypothetical protein